VKSISELKSTDYDAVIFPGGFGPAKNFSNFAYTQGAIEVHPEIQRVIESFYQDKKVVAGCCWTPVLLSYILGKHGVQVTLGKEGEKWPYQGSIS